MILRALFRPGAAIVLGEGDFYHPAQQFDGSRVQPYHIECPMRELDIGFAG